MDKRRFSVAYKGLAQFLEYAFRDVTQDGYLVTYNLTSKYSILVGHMASRA